MTPKEGILILFTFFLICLLGCFLCFERVQRKMDLQEVAVLRYQIRELEETNQKQDEMIGALIRTEAMKGYFDKKE